MGQLLLVRHGQASFGSDDYDKLSELGWEQGRVLGAALRARGVSADHVTIGAMRRHRETADACTSEAGWSVEPEVDPGWDEFDFLSVLAATPKPPTPPDSDDSKADFQRWFEVATQDWIAGADHAYPETFAAFCGRVGDALGRAAERSGTTVVFSSGGPIAWAVSSVLATDGRPELWTRLNRMAVNTGVTKLIAGARGINLSTYNDHGHVEGVPPQSRLLTYR